jgi:SpoVK/Ycf46/Vps4 family AAA+-type ATPase
MASQFITKTPQKQIEDVQLTGDTRNKFEAIIEEHNNGHLLRNMGLRPRYRLLFWGPAGTGKTMGAEAIAHALNRPLHIFNLETLHVGNPEVAVTEIMDAFRFINDTTGVFVFDEFDAIAESRTATNSNKVISNALLIAFEQIKGKSIVICATNFIDCIDPAFRRRFDTICKFELPSYEERKKILANRLLNHNSQYNSKFEFNTDADLDEAAKQTESLSYHETERITEDAIKKAILRKTNKINLIPELNAAKERRTTFKS